MMPPHPATPGAALSAALALARRLELPATALRQAARVIGSASHFDRLADAWLAIGRVDAAERLSKHAEELRAVAS